MKPKRLILLIVILTLILAGCQSAAEDTAEPVAEATAAPPTAPAPDAEPPAPEEPLPAEEAPTEVPPTAEPAPEPTPEPTPEPEFLSAWWNDTVFYEIFVRSFYDSDGDGVGDINGVIERLDYLNDGDPDTDSDLGVTGIWLMPIMESPTYHGYDVMDYYQIDQEYGTNEDFLRLIEEANARGIRVIVDLVLNHTADDHPWFQASLDPAGEFRDYYVWEAENPNFRGPNGQLVWHEAPSGYYYALFWEEMPDLNYRTPEVTADMFDVTRFWLEEMNADGFRLDAIKFLIADGEQQVSTPETHAWLKEFNDVYKEAEPEAFAIGEIWSPTFDVVNYVGDELDAAFEFDLAEAIIQAVDSGRAGTLARTQGKVVESYPPGQYGTFLTNHDQNRVMSQLRGDENKARLAATMLLTSPGVPFIYYGEEIGQSGVKPDEDIRLPLQWNDEPGAGFTGGEPWRPPAEDYTTRNIATQAADPDSLLSHYRSLIRLRMGHEALRTGSWTLVESDNSGVYAFLRQSGDEIILVLLNLGDEAVEEYALELPEGTLPPISSAAALMGAENPAPPEVNEAGGFSGYRPFPSLPPQSTSIILLQP